jgi:hypothetical protein
MIVITIKRCINPRRAKISCCTYLLTQNVCMLYIPTNIHTHNMYMLFITTYKQYVHAVRSDK